MLMLADLIGFGRNTARDVTGAGASAAATRHCSKAKEAKQVRDLLRYGRVTAIIGRGPCGKTLAAVALLKQFRDAGNLYPKIVTNIILKGDALKDYEPFDWTNLFDYKDSIIFYDMLELAVPARVIDWEYIQAAFAGFLNNLEESNCFFVFTTQTLAFVEPLFLPFIDVNIIPRYSRDKDDIKLMVMGYGDIKHRVIKGASSYFGLYDVMEIVLPSTLSLVLQGHGHFTIT